MDTRSLWLRLWHTPGLGAVRAQKLIQTFGNIDHIFAASPSALQTAGLPLASANSLLNNPQTAAVQKTLEWAYEPLNHIISWDDDAYPDLLRQSASPPAILFVKGSPYILNEPQIAMVGSRNPSSGGKDNAYQFAHYLSQSGLLIASGLALGIDGESHRGALSIDAHTAPSIAVVGTGLDRLYPVSHKALAEELLAKGGAIVSELPLGTSPKPSNFPQRNRIIAGLCLGTLVIEAALRSGSLITARQAQEAGREVFAIPGSIHNPLSKGCHELIKQGAKLVESADDILEELTPQLKQAISDYPHKPQNAPKTAIADEVASHEQLLTAMGYEMITINELSQRTDFNTSELASMLLILELEGKIRSESGGLFQRCQ